MGNRFEVDNAGLAALTARRDKFFPFAELLSNAWDAPAGTQVDVQATATPGKQEVALSVADDSTTGFTDLSHAHEQTTPFREEAAEITVGSC